MDDPSDIRKALWESIQALMADNTSGIDYRSFSSISDRFLREYGDLRKDGLAGQTIALAMLGATLNMYSMFGAHRQLPDLLRELADSLDQNRNLH